ncbi:hypothetical protein [Streptomyces malaysiensis]|uniref:hypothetical protein n=1 Tax=Streptomyces malaysiensis TaxID=92644 RepID=UPI00142EDE94|nr:hypothetical protein [Streptomyces malaysiensis]
MTRHSGSSTRMLTPAPPASAAGDGPPRGMLRSSRYQRLAISAAGTRVATSGA